MVAICLVGWHRRARGKDEFEREFRGRMHGTWGGRRENVQNDFQISAQALVITSAFYPALMQKEMKIVFPLFKKISYMLFTTILFISC